MFFRSLLLAANILTSPAFFCLVGLLLIGSLFYPFCYVWYHGHGFCENSINHINLRTLRVGTLSFMHRNFETYMSSYFELFSALSHIYMMPQNRDITIPCNPTSPMGWLSSLTIIYLTIEPTYITLTVKLEVHDPQITHRRRIDI